MCEQTEVRYLDGDVVWVKLGSCWWPGHVRDVDKLPQEILTSLKKRPIAAVKFFQEETFEYVRNLNQICMYNCRKKNEFIKKGLDIYRSRHREGSTVMDKFPEDVATAEKLTGGDPNILRNSAFAPDEKPNYRNIFGGDKKPGSPDKKNKSSGSPNKDWKVQTSPNGRRSQIKLPVLQQPRQITHPRFISEVKDDSDHVVRIRHQPVSTPSRDEQSSATPDPYKCHLCDFTSTRLNVIVLHNKFHTADAANNGRGGSAVSKCKSADGKSTGRGKGRASSGSLSERPRARSRTVPTTTGDTPIHADITVDRSAPKRKLIIEIEKETMKPAVSPKPPTTKSPEKTPKPEKKSPKTPIFGKRKVSKWGGERPVKKKKNDEEIREKLLADWDDEDEEQEEKEIELIKQELSKSELASLQGTPATKESPLKPKQTSCFDFDDAEDANLGSELEERAKKFVENRKIPRIIDDKGEIASKRRCFLDDIKSVESVSTKAPEPASIMTVEPASSKVSEPSTVKAVEPVNTKAPEPVSTKPLEPVESDTPEPISTKAVEPESTKEPEPVIDKSPATDTAKTGETPVAENDIDTAFKTLLAETTVPVLPEVPELPSPPPDLGSSASLPDVVLNSNNSSSTLNAESALSELTSGGDHDYSIKTDGDDIEIKDEEITPTNPEPHETNEDDEMELDINSMPVVMTDAIITEEPETKVPVQPLIDLIPLVKVEEPPPPTAAETPVIVSKCNVVATPSSSGATIVKAAPSTAIKTLKLKTTAAPSSVQSTAISKLKGTGGATVISQKGPSGGKLVIVQTSPGQQSRYTVGKSAQQRVTQQQIVQQAVGSGKVVILTKPQGMGQQRILTTGGKLQAQPQRIITSTGAILTPINPRSVMAKGTKFTPISQQQMRALQGGKQSLGPKLTMQSTQAKVILPTLQKAVTQTSPVRVIGTLKPQSNTILIQTTQGSTVSGTVLSKAPSGQPITRLPVTKPKILSSPVSPVQRISVPVTMAGKTLQGTQGQPKVLEIRPSGAPRMVVQKVQSPLPAKSGVGLLSQVKKVSGIFPRASSVQKISQAQKVQTVKKAVPQQKPADSKHIPIIMSNTMSTDVTSSQTLPNVTMGSSLQQNSLVISAPHSSVAQSSTIGLPTTVSSASGSSVITSEQIAHVVAATPSEQLGDGNTATYVLVTIDDSGALQPYDNSTLLTYDGNTAASESAARTLYIDPSSIGSSGELENIILTIDNSASSVLNPVTSSSVFNVRPTGQGTGGPNQDILAEALANTQVFQPDSAMQDSLTVVNSNQSTVMTPRLLEPSPLLPTTLHQATMLLPSLSTVLPSPNPAGVLETSLTLNQPIMTPLEVPSSAVPTLRALPPIPTSLELPLTITQPALSVTSQSYPSLASTVKLNPSMPLLSEEADSHPPLNMTEGRLVEDLSDTETPDESGQVPLLLGDERPTQDSDIPTTNHSSSSHLTPPEDPENPTYILPEMIPPDTDSLKTGHKAPLPSFTKISENTLSIAADPVEYKSATTDESDHETVDDPSSQFQGKRESLLQVAENGTSADHSSSQAQTDASSQKTSELSEPQLGPTEANVPHSMPLLLDEVPTGTTSKALEGKSPLHEEDVEMTEKNVLDQSERSKDQGSLSPESVPCPDLHHAEMADSDEDLPCAFPPSEQSKKRDFQKDEVVWVRCKKMYWPAVITNINKRANKVYIKTVNSPRKCRAMKMGAKCIVDFEDRERNKQFYELGRTSHGDFVSAYNKVKQYYVKKSHQSKLSAVRYLTFDPEDILYGTLQDNAETTVAAEDPEVLGHCNENSSDSQSEKSSVDLDDSEQNSSNSSHKDDDGDFVPLHSPSLMNWSWIKPSNWSE